MKYFFNWCILEKNKKSRIILELSTFIDILPNHAFARLTVHCKFTWGNVDITRFRGRVLFEHSGF